MRPSACRWLPAWLTVLALAGCGSSQPGTTTTTSTSKPHAHVPGVGGPTQSGAGRIGAEGILIERGPSLAPASSTAPGTPVHGVRCPPGEQVAYHIHAHLQVYVYGRPRQLPGAIGIVGPVPQQTRYGPFFAATGCYYWLHTHTADGIIHVESPSLRVYTLGDFFDEWRQPLGRDVVATARGPVTAFLNGRRWTRNPRALPLVPRGQIQLDVGRPLVPFHRISFGRSGL